jgi:8-oxo-dGTP diphosphatase
MTTVVSVAVGILQDTQGRVLVSRRAAAAHQGGLWEFPGGKVEPSETTESALAREFKEELGVDVLASEDLMVVEHDYGDKQVCLKVRRVTQWRGEARGLEGQPLAWQKPEVLINWSFPEANTPILMRLTRD